MRMRIVLMRIFVLSEMKDCRLFPLSGDGRQFLFLHLSRAFLRRDLLQRDIGMVVFAAPCNVLLLAHPDGLHGTPMEAGKAGRAVFADHGTAVPDRNILHGTNLCAGSAADTSFIRGDPTEIVRAANRRQRQKFFRKMILHLAGTDRYTRCLHSIGICGRTAAICAACFSRYSASTSGGLMKLLPGMETPTAKDSFCPLVRSS